MDSLEFSEVKMGEKTDNMITVRLLMQGKEVGSIIGKKGDNIKLTREQSGARITISDGSTPERIVTINGAVENVNKAFAMICKKFEDDLKLTCNANAIPPITLRLIVPASQCGSIIGKGGSKIKEIRELTGASIQVASEMLPGSTERAVTVSGKFDSIIECFKQVSSIMLESPPKGDTLSYKPRQVAASTINAPIIFAHGQAFQVQGQYAIPLPPHEVAKLIQIGALTQVQPSGAMPATAALMHNQAPTPPMPQVQAIQGGQQQQGSAVAAAAAAAASLAAGAGSGNQNRSVHNVQTTEMSIPNDLIGCIIGRGGQKISEIRLVSGANIKIADLEDGNPDRHVSITGTPDQIQLAQFLINASNSSSNIHDEMAVMSTTTATAASTGHLLESSPSASASSVCSSSSSSSSSSASSSNESNKFTESVNGNCGGDMVHQSSSSSPFKSSSSADMFIHNSNMLTLAAGTTGGVYTTTSSHPALSNYALVHNARANASNNNSAEFLSNPLSLSDLSNPVGNNNGNSHNNILNNSSNNLVLSGGSASGIGGGVLKTSSELSQFKLDLSQKMYLDHSHGQAAKAAMAAAVNANLIAQNAAAANLHMLKSNNYQQQPTTSTTTPTSLMQPLFYFQQQLQPNQYHVQAQQYEQQQQQQQQQQHQQQQQYQQKFQYQHQSKQFKIINAVAASSGPVTGTGSNLVNNDFLNSVKSLKDIKKTQLHFKPY